MQSIRFPLLLSLLVLFALACGLGGCSTYAGGYDYHPQPASVPLTLEGPGQAASLNTLATVRGVLRNDEVLGAPAVDVGLRFANESDRSVLVLPLQLQLVAADLQAFGRPRIVPDGLITLGPGESAQVRAIFPFPPGQTAARTDMDGLNLRVTARIDGQLATGSASFDRMLNYRYAQPGGFYPWGGYYGYYPGPRSSVFIGSGFYY